jgi:hypothetical protein
VNALSLTESHALITAAKWLRRLAFLYAATTITLLGLLVFAFVRGGA